MSGYVFISNSRKPTEAEQHSREPVKLGNFSRPCLQAALDMGYDVWFGVNRANPETLDCELAVQCFESHTYRSILPCKDNWTAYRNLMKVLNENDIEVIHCNTPIGGVLGRLCGKRCKVKRIIYTAHGFHFYKGAPLINSTLYKLAEMWLAHYTDVIITMNEEDYIAAQKLHLREGGRVYKVPGVGIDVTAFQIEDANRQASYTSLGVDDEEYLPARTNARMKLGLKPDDIVLISVGRLDRNKNNATLIRALAQVDSSKVHFLLCGCGEEDASLNQLAKKLNIASRTHFLGLRDDVPELLDAADIYMSASKREGLPRAMMEAMACGLPCVASRIRGNVDLIEDGVNGYLCSPTEPAEFSKAIEKLIGDEALRQQMRKENLERIKQYDISVVDREIQKIYQEVLLNKSVET